ncbi:MAG: hypothetical protein WCP32_15450 [Bacteroidota bacterium]
MEDKLDILFQQWNKFDSKVFISEIKPTEKINIENLIAETTMYCRYSGRLTWILIDWLIRYIDIIDSEKLLNTTLDKGDVTILGLVSDLAKQKRNSFKFEYLIKASKPNDKKEVFFYRVLKSKLASKLTIEQTLPIYDKWNFYCSELRYLTTDNELNDIKFKYTTS